MHKAWWWAIGSVLMGGVALATALNQNGLEGRIAVPAQGPLRGTWVPAATEPVQGILGTLKQLTFQTDAVELHWENGTHDSASRLPAEDPTLPGRERLQLGMGQILDLYAPA